MAERTFLRLLVLCRLSSTLTNYTELHTLNKLENYFCFCKIDENSIRLNWHEFSKCNALKAIIYVCLHE
jgi:hypothetical protein